MDCVLLLIIIIIDAFLLHKGCLLHNTGIKVREQCVLEQVFDSEVFSDLSRDGLEVEQLLLLLIEVPLDYLQVIFFKLPVAGLVLDLLKLKAEEVPHKVVSVNSRVPCEGERAVKAVEYKVGELVGTAYSEALRVHPDHGELVEKHLEVDHRVHSDLPCNEQSCGRYKDWQVSNQKEGLVQSLRVRA